MKVGLSRTCRWAVPFVALLLVGLPVGAADYYTHASMTEHLAWLARSEPNLVRVGELARSQEQRAVWMVEVGAGSEEDRTTRPALLVVAGIEGNDLVGPFAVLSWIDRLAREYREGSPTTDLLNTTTVYVVPCLNPDAMNCFFTVPRIERNVNGTPNDEDHDGFRDEDGCEDLNGDGLVTLMRVEDKEGQYIVDPNEPRLLLKADPLKGEVPVWRLLTEGIDNDRDRRWNEDGPGGVNFNRNFPCNYRYFAPDAGVHPVSENETRALADFVVAHPNIGIVLTYGAADNLRKTPPSGPPAQRSKAMDAVNEKDIGYYEAIGKVYRAKLGLSKDLDGASNPGTLSDWMYFHRGRLSLAARPWDPGVEIETSESPKDKDPNDANAPGAKKMSDEGRDKRGKEQREQLKWFDEHAPDAFIAWQTVEHPDFPGRKVEVGGWRPFARTNPPAGMLEEVAARHGEFLTDMAGRLPRIQVAKIECRLLADSLYEIEILVTNVGFLPTVLAHGEISQQVQPTRLTLGIEPRCFLAGERVTRLPAIAGSGGTAKVRCTVRVPDRDSLQFEVTSALAGRIQGTIELLKAGEK